MPKSLSGKISAVMLAIFVIQFIAFIISIVNYNPLGAIVNFIYVAPFTTLPGLVSGLIAIKKERGKIKIMPIITIIISIVYIGFTLFFLYGWSFGG